MKAHSLTHRAFHSKGITLIEILMVVSLLAILISFAAPSIGGAVAQAEMTATVENVEFSIQTARDIARMNDSGVSLDIETLPYEAGQIISFSYPDRAALEDAGYLQDYRPPQTIHFIPDHDSFIFDNKGLVKNPGRILLVSTENDSITATVHIE